MQAVFSHEQALVLELAKLVDESMTAAQRTSNTDKPPLAADSIEQIFDHAANALKETGRMMTEIRSTNPSRSCSTTSRDRPTAAKAAAPNWKAIKEQEKRMSVRLAGSPSNKPISSCADLFRASTT